MGDCTKESGTCERCVGACKHKPGWFRPGEIDAVAEFLGLSTQELFDTRLAIDWWEADATLPLTFIVAPAKVGEEAGTEYPFSPKGRCVFLTDDDRCEIHRVKPFECREYWCGAPASEVVESVNMHRETAALWREHQDEPAALLGRDPVLPDPSILDIIDTLS